MKIRSLLTTLILLALTTIAPVSAQEMVVIGGTKYIIHDVVKGETLYSLAKRYGVTVDDIRRDNSSLANGLKAGQRIKIAVKSDDKSAAERAEPI